MGRGRGVLPGWRWPCCRAGTWHGSHECQLPRCGGSQGDLWCCVQNHFASKMFMMFRRCGKNCSSGRVWALACVLDCTLSNLWQNFGGWRIFSAVLCTQLSSARRSEPGVEIHGAVKSLGNFVLLTSVWARFHSCILVQIHLRITLFASENK